MPDIDFKYDPSLHHEDGQSLRIGDGSTWQNPGYVREQIRPIVAHEMDCLDRGGKPITHTPDQIKFRSFAPFPDSGDAALVSMLLYAFDWPSRMLNLDTRLENIGDGVAGVLGLPEKTVDVGFIELRHPRGKYQRPGWVRA